MKNAPAIHIAEDYIKTLIKDTPSHISRLPTIRTLAAQSGVSVPTLSKALKKFIQKGILYSSQGQGIFIIDRMNSSKSEEGQIKPELTREQPFKVWQRVAAEIEKSILNGKFRTEVPFPASKELQARYSVSYLTIRKSLLYLVKKGLLEPYSRGFKVSLSFIGNSVTKVVLIEPGYLKDKIRIYEGLGSNFIHSLEKNCSQSNISLDVIGVSGTEEEPIYIDPISGNPISLQAYNDTYGFLYTVKFTEEEAYLKIPQDLIQFSKPVAFLDMTGEWSPPTIVSKSSQFKIFRTSISTKPAIDMGRYLLNSGHKKIAYISPFHKLQWSKTRYIGLTDVYSSAGCPDNVSLYANTEFSSRYKLFLNVRRIRNMPWPLHGQKWWNQIPEPFRKQMVSQMNNAAYNRYADGAVYEMCIPLFEDALEKKDVTAWVLCNDLVASMAYTYLREKGVEIPGKISIVGFDDSILALQYRITSYNFNVEAAADAMIQYVLRPHTFNRTWKDQVVDINGTVVERSTSRKIEY